ncbi:helix-turn-helix domain-containing protein [Streptomyces sp. NPDC001758]
MVRPVAVGAVPRASAALAGGRKRHRRIHRHGTIPARLTCRYMGCMGYRPGAGPGRSECGVTVSVSAQDGVAGFAALLRELKDRTDRSYGSLARRLNMNTSTLHRYCAGEAVPVDFAPVERFAALCGATGEERLELHRRWLHALESRQRPRGTDGSAATETPTNAATPPGPPPTPARGSGPRLRNGVGLRPGLQLGLRRGRSRTGGRWDSRRSPRRGPRAGRRGCLGTPGGTGCLRPRQRTGHRRGHRTGHRAGRPERARPQAVGHRLGCHRDRRGVPARGWSSVGRGHRQRPVAGGRGAGPAALVPAAQTGRRRPGHRVRAARHRGEPVGAAGRPGGVRRPGDSRRAHERLRDDRPHPDEPEWHRLTLPFPLRLPHGHRLHPPLHDAGRRPRPRLPPDGSTPLPPRRSRRRGPPPGPRPSPGPPTPTSGPTGAVTTTSSPSRRSRSPRPRPRRTPAPGPGRSRPCAGARRWWSCRCRERPTRPSSSPRYGSAWPAAPIPRRGTRTPWTRAAAARSPRGTSTWIWTRTGPSPVPWPGTTRGRRSRPCGCPTGSPRPTRRTP